MKKFKYIRSISTISLICAAISLTGCKTVDSYINDMLPEKYKNKYDYEDNINEANSKSSADRILEGYELFDWAEGLGHIIAIPYKPEYFNSQEFKSNWSIGRFHSTWFDIKNNEFLVQELFQKGAKDFEQFKVIYSNKDVKGFYYWTELNIGNYDFKRQEFPITNAHDDFNYYVRAENKHSFSPIANVAFIDDYHKNSIPTKKMRNKLKDYLLPASIHVNLKNIYPKYLPLDKDKAQGLVNRLEATRSRYGSRKLTALVMFTLKDNVTEGKGYRGKGYYLDGSPVAVYIGENWRSIGDDYLYKKTF